MTSRAYRVRRVLLWITLGVLGVVVVACALSYWHSASVLVVCYSTQGAAQKNQVASGTVLIQRSVEIGCAHGAIGLWTGGVHQSEADLMYHPDFPDWPHWRWRLDPPMLSAFRSGARFRWRSLSNWESPGLSVRFQPTQAGTQGAVMVHGSLLALLFGSLACWLWFNIRASIKLELDQRCPSCAYDRRGLAAEAACPECGGRATGGA